MNNFDHLLNQLKRIQDKFDNIEIFLTGTYLEFHRNQFEKLLAALEAKHASECSHVCSREQLQQSSKEDILHDSKYAESRIGVSEKTIYRLTQRGMLPIDSYQNGKKQFRSSDIERCRRFYRGED